MSQWDTVAGPGFVFPPPQDEVTVPFTGTYAAASKAVERVMPWTWPDELYWGTRGPDKEVFVSFVRPLTDAERAGVRRMLERALQRA